MENDKKLFEEHTCKSEHDASCKGCNPPWMFLRMEADTDGEMIAIYQGVL